MKQTNSKIRKIINIVAVIIIILPVYLAYALEEAQVSNGIERRVVKYEAGGMKDPFESPRIKKEAPIQVDGGISEKQTPSTPLPSFIVKGVVWGGDRPQAIIDEKVVNIGDIVEGAEITDINKNGIIILFEGREYNLLSPAKENIKRPAKETTGGRYER